MELDLPVETEATSSCGGSSEAVLPETACESDPCSKPQRRQGGGPDRRNEKVDRRTGLDRRAQPAEAAGYDGPNRRKADDRRATLERRRGPGRRRSDDRKSAEEGEMSGHQFEFVMAVQTYKKVNKRLYPTWTEILEIVNQLGYRKVLPRTVKLDAPEPDLTAL
jgi:hypothetical protein